MVVRVGYIQSWRREFYDLIRSLSELEDEGLSIVRLRDDQPFITNSVDIIIVSDDQSIPVGANNDFPIVRVCWNGAPEVLASVAADPSRAHEHNLTFFTDVASELSKVVSTIQVPFAFSNPSFMRVPSVKKIGFIGEVDVSSDCFQIFGSAISEEAIRSVAEQSERIFKAQVSLSETLHSPPVEMSSDIKLLSAWKWSVNNWVRWRFISSLIDNFPNQIDLRGNDWVALGYQAKRSRFNPLFREYAYQRNAISIDFGSKSTTDRIYPRTAEIIANHGGLLQLNSGSTHQNLMPILEKHQFVSEGEMVRKVEERFAGNRKIWQEMDAELYSELLALRRLSVHKLLESFYTLLKK